jgi:hypothetical protein
VCYLSSSKFGRTDDALHSPHVHILGFSENFITILQEVSRLLLGLNSGRTLDKIVLPEPTKALSSEHDFDVQVGICTTCCYGGSVLESPSTTRFTINSFSLCFKFNTRKKK